ncbi:MAG: RsmB/NOP family class I SAM-dependent RNA methyltransferase [Bacteroidia bacterium]|nr:RsmB/NOP family class I SAM-dependent RNA methyltransferase [Bacteroidia bacterium]MDW8415996.1 RsmB/NOP family class I SAM-dependent RNA methyltransferase [Bacteroidia bacterium]
MILPEAFVVRMRARLQEEAEPFFHALQAPPNVTIRLNPYKGKNLFPEARCVPWHPLGRVLHQRPDFEHSPLWHAGAYYVQEASGMSLRNFLPERRPLRVLDLSAAPGGKSTLILGELGLEGGLLIANDPDPKRRAALRENLERWGIPSYFITGRHPQYWAQRYPEAFDVVVLDAPCSGEGLWRKDDRAICQWSPQGVKRMQRFQRSLLFAAKALVAPGGRLIYSTCTFAPEENEDNLAFAFANDASWHPVFWETAPPEVIRVRYAGEGIGYYFYPHRCIGEGFFISAWGKEGRPALYSKPYKTVSSPFLLPKNIRAIKRGEQFYALTESAIACSLPDWDKEIWEAFPIWEHARPTHAAALLAAVEYPNFPERPLSTEEFMHYLAGRHFNPQAALEWVTVSGLGVGWLYKGRPSLPFTWRRFLRHYQP